MDDVIRAMARQQLETPDEELARRVEEQRAAEEGAAEAARWAARLQKGNAAEDDDALDGRLRRNTKRIAYGWGALDEPPRPGPFDE